MSSRAASRARSGSAATPGVLFRSDDRGESWEPVTSLIEHETRERWNPGRGRDVHALDPARPGRTPRRSTSASRPRASSAARTAASRGRREQGHGRRLHPRRPVPRGRPVRPQGARPSRAGRSASGSRTTAASTAPTTAARTGSGSRTTGCRASSASRSRIDHRRAGHGVRDPGGLGAARRARSGAATA